MKKILITFICIAAVAVLSAAIILFPKFRNMKSEYVTAGVIKTVTAYVQKNPGKWPRCWNDLGGTDHSQYTRMNFSLNPATATREEVLSAISPNSDKYMTYPHAKKQMEKLWTIVKKHQQQTD